ncbi:MAG TPA: diacylglycerol kinase family protein [Zeimonas sp.]|nr:diacylglycerol kinase family protein [Zeimonas sp.]
MRRDGAPAETNVDDTPVVLLNPRAAGGRAWRLAGPLRRWLSSQAPALSLQVVEGIDDARATLRARPEGSRVVVVGGDGTVHQLLPALLERRLSLGLVPVGSGNDLARALGLYGLARRDAMTLALNGPASRCDLGELLTETGRIPFASSLAAGFDAAVAWRAVGGPAWMRGLPRYLWATLVELAALRPWRLRASVDGVVVHDGEALFASCLNTPSYGAGMPAVPGARIDDGRLDLLVAGRFGRAGALAMLPRLLLGRHLSHPEVRTASFAEMRIDCDGALPLAADGEPLGAARGFTVRVLPAGLRVVRGRGVLVQNDSAPALRKT